jgi:hypothetical protein
MESVCPDAIWLVFDHRPDFTVACSGLAVPDAGPPRKSCEAATVFSPE